MNLPYTFVPIVLFLDVIDACILIELVHLLVFYHQLSSHNFNHWYVRWFRLFADGFPLSLDSPFPHLQGQLKNVITTIAGFFLFGGAPMTLTGGFGLTASTAASVWYGYIKFQQAELSRAVKRKEEELDKRLSKV